MEAARQRGLIEYTDYSVLEFCDQEDKATRPNTTQHFPAQLFKMLSSAQTEGFSEICVWQPHGRAFKIFDRDAFVKDVMPRYFKQSQFGSFQRQLNMYGFIRMAKRGDDYRAYYHELFLRGRPDLCSRITRVKSDPEERFSRREPDFYSMDPVGDGPVCERQLSPQSKRFDNGMLAQIGGDQKRQAGLRTAAEISKPSSRQITREKLSSATINAVDRERLQNGTPDVSFSVAQPDNGKHVGVSSAALCFARFPNDRGNDSVRGLHQLTHASFSSTLSDPALITTLSQEPSIIASVRVCSVETSGPASPNLLTRHWVDHSTSSFSQRDVDQNFHNASSPSRRPPWIDQQDSLSAAYLLQSASNLSGSESESCPTSLGRTTGIQAFHNSDILLPSKSDAFLQLRKNYRSAMTQAVRAGDHPGFLTQDIHPPPTPTRTLGQH